MEQPVDYELWDNCVGLEEKKSYRMICLHEFKDYTLHCLDLPRASFSADATVKLSQFGKSEIDINSIDIKRLYIKYINLDHFENFIEVNVSAFEKDHKIAYEQLLIGLSDLAKDLAKNSDKWI